MPPWALDATTRRLFEKRIYTRPLPEEADRRSLFEMHIGDMPTLLSGADLVMLRLS